MPNSLGFYISGSPAAAALAQKYGDQLQNVGLEEKLIAIMAISGALFDGLVNRDCEPSIEERVYGFMTDGDEVDSSRSLGAGYY